MVNSGEQVLVALQPLEPGLRNSDLLIREPGSPQCRRGFLPGARSAGGDFGHAEAAQALELVPAVAAHAEETQHPPVAPAAELADAAALGPDMLPQPPAINHGIPVGAPDEGPAADEDQADEGFEGEQGELERHQQQEQAAGVLEERQQMVAVGVEALGVAGAELDGRAAPGGVDLRRAAMVQPRRGLTLQGLSFQHRPYNREDFEWQRAYNESPAASQGELAEAVSKGPKKAGAPFTLTLPQAKAAIHAGKPILQEASDTKLLTAMSHFLEQTRKLPDALLLRWKLRRLLETLAADRSIALPSRELGADKTLAVPRIPRTKKKSKTT